MNPVTVTETSHPTSMPVDPAVVSQLALTLEAGDLTVIHHFGREIGVETARHADTLLQQVQSKDLDTMGSRLSEIVVAAKSLNIEGLSEERSRIPLIGGLIDKLRVRGESVLTQFQDVKTQIDKLVGEVETMQSGLSQRVTGLDDTFASVQTEHQLLEIHLQAGAQALERLRERLVADPATLDAAQLQGQADLRAALAALEKRLADFRVLQHSALQQLPMIRMVQANNRMLVEKFFTIKELTIPAWKRQFSMALSLNEQRNAVELAEAIDDATNDFLKENARLLHDNTVATARANQRLVIDIDTLTQVHQTLMKTVQDVVDINRAGASQRDAATQQLRVMRQELAQRLGGA